METDLRLESLRRPAVPVRTSGVEMGARQLGTVAADDPESQNTDTRDSNLSGTSRASGSRVRVS